MTDWKALEHHRGEASDIPKIVADVFGGPDTPDGREERFNHHLTLQDRLYREGQWVEAAPATIKLLVDALEGSGLEKHRALWHIILLTTGGVEWAFSQGLPLHGADDEYRGETLQATLDHLANLMPFLRSEDPLFSARTAQLLGLLPGADAVRVTALSEVAQSSAPVPTRFNAFLALGLIAGHQGVSVASDVFETGLGAETAPLVRGGAALGALWSGERMTPELGDGLTEVYPAMHWGPEYNWYPLKLLQWIPREPNDRFEIARRWLEAWNERPFRPIEAPTIYAFGLIGSDRNDAELRIRENLEDFSEEEQVLIQLAAHRNQLGGSCPAHVPGPLRARRRWLGEDPPSLLEKRCPWEETSKPVWARWWDLVGADELDAQGVPRAWSAASSLERLQLICEAKAQSYSLNEVVTSVTGDDVRALAEQCVAAKQGFEDWACRFLSDVGGQPDTGSLTHVAKKGEYARPLMLVLLQNGTELPEPCDGFLRFDNDGDHAVIRRLPLARRRKILLAAREQWPLYQAIVNLLPVFPFREFASAALATINEKRGAEGAAQRKGNRVLQQLIPLAEEHPEIAEALAEARARPDWVPED